MDELLPAERLIDDVETIKVFADARRLRILQLMRQPITVKAVAAQLQLPPSKLYYHVNLLHDHGLIQIVDHNIDGGIVEKVYQVAARRFKLQNPLLMGAEVPSGAKGALLGSMVDEAKGALLGALAAGVQDTQQPPRYPFVSSKRVRLTEAQLTALHQRLDALIQDVTALGQANESTAVPAYNLTLLFVPTRSKQGE